MARRLNYSGFVIAGIGFFLTRFTVTLVIYEDPLRFYFAGIVPLVLGLGLAAFGVALAVADIDPATVRTTAVWCIIGFVTMLALVLITLLGSGPNGTVDLAALRSQTYLSNFLIGGSLGGTVTGLYAARNRNQRRQLRGHANRLETLNRILRHEILNAVNAIQGYANTDAVSYGRAREVIGNRSETIRQAVDEVKYLSRQEGGGPPAGKPIDLKACLDESVERITSRYPEVSVNVEEIPDDVAVRANERLTRVFVELLENAIHHGDEPTPRIKVAEYRDTVTVSVVDSGPGLPAKYARLLESAGIEEYDNPKRGFGLDVVRLLVESYRGRLTASVDDGTRISVSLPRADATAAAVGPTRSELAHVRPAVPHLVIVFLAATVAAVSYGLVSEAFGGSVAAIGVFYGVQDPVVGWLTHVFHSVVFAFMYLGVLSVALERYPDRLRTYLSVGLVWAIVVWVAAASVVAPTWLRLLGIPAPVPNFSEVLLLSHLAWGATLGIMTRFGYVYGLPWTSELSRALVPPAFRVETPYDRR